MKQIILNVPDQKFPFFMELVNSFPYIETQTITSGETHEGDSKEDILKNIKKGLEEVKLAKQGKLKTTSAKDFLNEL